MENALSDPERAHKSRRVEAESKGKAMAPATATYFVYVLVCSDGTLYVGSTSDLVQRERAHNEGRGAKYTASRRPVRMVYSEVHESQVAAQRREAQLKGWTRAKKEALIEANRSRLHQLAKRRR
jgi:putative endonuclease